MKEKLKKALIASKEDLGNISFSAHMGPNMSKAKLYSFINGDLDFPEDTLKRLAESVKSVTGKSINSPDFKDVEIDDTEEFVPAPPKKKEPVDKTLGKFCMADDCEKYQPKKLGKNTYSVMATKFITEDGDRCRDGYNINADRYCLVGIGLAGDALVNSSGLMSPLGKDVISNGIKLSNPFVIDGELFVMMEHVRARESMSLKKGQVIGELKVI